ncbi:PcfJ domain-containing protein [bacterium]|nr:PcfJ domain-containing protein [bacterium]
MATPSSLLLPGQIEDDDLRRHFCALGVGTVAAYKLWCYRHGLSTDLRKTPEQRDAERALFDRLRPAPDPEVSRHHNPRRADLLARILTGEFREETLSDVPSRIRKIYNALDGDQEARDALRRLVLHAEKYGDLFRPSHAFPGLPPGFHNTYVAGLGQLARRHRDWLRPVEAWRPDSGKPRRQFYTLARHLLARYHVPPCMDAAWFQGDTPDARQQQAWFKHVGFGQNIRTAGVPMKITKRMAHLFTNQRSARLSILRALRMAQVEALGGAPPLAWSISSILGKSLENEDFWVTVVHFFVNNPMLEGSYVEPIVDYIRHQKFTPSRTLQPDGTFVEGPPSHPGFSIKGRSAVKLLRQVDEWHVQLTGEENIRLEKWEPSKFREFSHTEIDSETGRTFTWAIHELLTSAQLAVEGRVMHHCVASYTRRCVSGEASIWSLRVQDMDAAELEPYNVLTIALDTKKRLVTQARGRYNLQPFDRAGLAKQRRTGRPYLRLLRESGRILRLWMDREGLTHG